MKHLDDISTQDLTNICIENALPLIKQMLELEIKHKYKNHPHADKIVILRNFESVVTTLQDMYIERMGGEVLTKTVQ